MLRLDIFIQFWREEIFLKTNFEVEWEKLLRQLILLPPAWRESVAWILHRLWFLIELCSIEALTEEKRREAEAWAIEQEDSIAYLIVQLERAIHTDMPAGV